MTKIYPFQRTARWLSLGFLVVAILLGSWVTTAAQTGEPEDPRKKDPRLDEVKKQKLSHDLSSGEVVIRETGEGIEPVALSAHHEMLQKLVGHWMIQERIFTAPGAPPIEVRGVARSEMILDGRALRMDYKGSFQGKPFVGLGLDGYDVERGRHFSSWMDNSSTGMTYNVGSRCTHDPADMVSYHGEVVDPETGKAIKTRTRLTLKTSSTYIIEQWHLPEDGEETPSMQIIFTRQAE